MVSPVYAIVSDRPWHRDLPDRLAARCPGCFTLIETRCQLTAERLQELRPRYVFVPHWSSKIPEDIHERYEVVIFHMTDLPYGRGGSPLQNLIVRGHGQTVVTALRCTENLDAGPVYLKRPLDLTGPAHAIFRRASHVVEEMIVDIIQQEPEPKPQTGTPTYFARRAPHDGNLRNVTTLAQIYDFVRMLDADGYPSAFLDVGPFRLEFCEAQWDSGEVTARVRFTTRNEAEND